MANFAITGHGGRKGGTAKGTYVVPKGVTIYFFTKDDTVLYAGASDVLFDNLCCAHPKELAVRSHAVDVKTEWETCPNYTCFGTNDFRDPSGVYRVGQAISAGPYDGIPNHTEKRLSDIVGNAKQGSAIGSHIYWLCCRAAPDNSNNIDDDADIVTGHLSTGDEIGAREVGHSSGLTPSQVKQLGSWR